LTAEFPHLYDEWNQFPRIENTMLTGDMLRRSAARFPDKAAIVYRGPDGVRRVDYRTLEQDANRLANALCALGLKKGATVAMLARNLPEYGTVFFGVARSGLLLNNISVLYAPDELAWVLNKSKTEVLILDVAFADKVEAVRRQCPDIRTFISIGESGLPQVTPLRRFIDGCSTEAPDVALDERDAFCMTYTGGTTGRPKGVLMNHRARAITAHTVVVEERLGAEDVVGIVTPLFHVAALNIMFQPAVEQEKITAAFMVPTQANALVNHPALDRRNLASWTKLSFAGAPMPDWVQQELMKKLPGLKLTQIYGQSEMGVIAALPPACLPQKLGSVGRQPYNVDVAVLRPDGTRTAPREATTS
jgi:fatty-acyl-CoA synthase